MNITGLFRVLLATTLVHQQTVQGFCIIPRSRSSLTIALGSKGDNNITPLEALELRDTTEGTGEVAAFGSIVTVKYAGSLLVGSDRGQPPFDRSMISFKLGYGKVLAGCDEGIRSMRVGGVRVLKIPSKLGFGPAGFGPEPYSIPPNSDLEYTVELIAVASGPMAEAAAKMGIGLDRNTVYLQ